MNEYAAIAGATALTSFACFWIGHVFGRRAERNWMGRELKGKMAGDILAQCDNLSGPCARPLPPEEQLREAHWQQAGALSSRPATAEELRALAMVPDRADTDRDDTQ